MNIDFERIWAGARPMQSSASSHYKTKGMGYDKMCEYMSKVWGGVGETGGLYVCMQSLYTPPKLQLKLS